MGKVACERCRLLCLAVKDRDAVIDRNMAIRVSPTSPRYIPGYCRPSHRETHTVASQLDEPPWCRPHPLAAHIDEDCALQEFCKTPAATYLRERLGRCPHKTVKAHPPARVPRN
jgi:hypothetical protein